MDSRAIDVMDNYINKTKKSPYMYMPDSEMVVYGLQGYRCHGYSYIYMLQGNCEISHFIKCLK